MVGCELEFVGELKRVTLELRGSPGVERTFTSFITVLAVEEEEDCEAEEDCDEEEELMQKEGSSTSSFTSSFISRTKQSEEPMNEDEDPMNEDKDEDVEPIN